MILVKPLSTQDVSVAVKFAVYYDLKISVRSGGHSYQCLGTKVSTKSSFLIPILFYRKIITFKSKKQKQKVWKKRKERKKMEKKNRKFKRKKIEKKAEKFLSIKGCSINEKSYRLTSVYSTNYPPWKLPD